MRRWSNSVTSKRILAQRRAETRGWPLEAGGRGHVSPARICRHGEIVPAGGSCSRCREEARARYRRRGSASVRGYDRAYVRLRPQVLSEEQVCWLCGLPARSRRPAHGRPCAPACARWHEPPHEPSRGSCELQLVARRSPLPRRLESGSRDVRRGNEKSPVTPVSSLRERKHSPPRLPTHQTFARFGFFPGHHRDQPPTGGRGSAVGEGSR
jgi:hypothetical protein